MKQSISTMTASSQLSRRQFLQGMAGLGLSATGLTLLPGCRNQLATPRPEEEPLETTTIRLVQIPGICHAAQYVAEGFLHDEGFTDVQFLKKPGAKGIQLALASGEA